MKKFGPFLGILVLVGIVAGLTFTPSSCSSLTPEQQQRLQSIAVPAAGILSHVAVQKGWIEPGDKITIQRGVAVVTSAQDPEAKLFALAELGITEALNKGLVSEGDVIMLKNEDVITITSPPEPAQAPGPAIPVITRDPAKESVLKLSPPAGG